MESNNEAKLNYKNGKSKKVEDLQHEFTDTELTILRRRSVRGYKKAQVPEFMIKRILEAGRFAPSAGNCQPWKFVVLRDPEIISSLTDTVINICKFFKKIVDYRVPGRRFLRPFANIFIRLKPADMHPTPFGAISFIADGKLGLYHGAPTVIIVFKDVRGIANPDLDCGIAGQNMVLAAHSMGLGTCWVGFAKLAFQYSSKWRKKFNIEYPYKFVTSLSVGWPKGEPDGFIERSTHSVDWYEEGSKRVIF